MPRIDVPFKVDKQIIIQTPPVKIAAGGKNYFYAVFDLCETWNDVTAEKAVFIRDDIRKLMSLSAGENDCLECKIPWEVMQEPGFFYVGIFGGDTLLTNTTHVKVIEGCIREGDEPLPPTPDWFNKVENDATEAKAMATKVAEDAAAGKFDGKDGKDGEQGPQGEKGDKGDKGEQGIPGEKGERGERGEKGDKGDTGEQGQQGIQGIQGEKGEPGNDYILTEADKTEIAGIVLSSLPNGDEVSY